MPRHDRANDRASRCACACVREGRVRGARTCVYVFHHPLYALALRASLSPDDTGSSELPPPPPPFVAFGGSKSDKPTAKASKAIATSAVVTLSASFA